MPFVGTALFEDSALMIENDAFDLRLNLEAFRNAGETVDNGLKRFVADRSRLRLARVFRLKDRSRLSKPGFLASLPFFNGVDFISRHFEPQIELGFQRGGVVFAQRSSFEQLALVKLRDRRALLDFYVKIRLGK